MQPTRSGNLQSGNASLRKQATCKLPVRPDGKPWVPGQAMFQSRSKQGCPDLVGATVLPAAAITQVTKRELTEAK